MIRQSKSLVKIFRISISLETVGELAFLCDFVWVCLHVCVCRPVSLPLSLPALL